MRKLGQVSVERCAQLPQIPLTNWCFLRLCLFTVQIWIQGSASTATLSVLQRFFFFICNCVSRGQRVQTEIHLLCLCFLIFEPPHSNTSLQFLKCCLYFWKPSIMSSLLFICLSSINPTFLLFSLSLALHSILKMQPPSHIPSPPPCPYLCSFSLFQLAFWNSGRTASHYFSLLILLSVFFLMQFPLHLPHFLLHRALEISGPHGPPHLPEW